MRKLYCRFLMIFSILYTSCQSDFDKRLHDVAQKYTESRCPQEVEPGTILDSLTYNISTRVYTSHYTLNNSNSVLYQTNSPLLHHLLVERVRDNAEYKELKDKHVTFGFVYYSEATKSVVYQTKITSNEYTK